MCDDDQLDGLSIELPAGWFPTRPAPIGTVPAVEYAGRFRGRRVTVGKPGWGWRYDLRADDPVDERGLRMVPVLDEAAWYRSEHDQVEVFAPLVPIEHVWVEVEIDLNADSAPPDATPGLLDRLVTLDTPPIRYARPARDVPALTGRRLVVSNPQVDRRAVRAISEPYVRDDGDICVRVADEDQWYRWSSDGIPPAGVTCPIHLLWVES